MSATTSGTAATKGPWSVFSNPHSNYGLEIVADVNVKAKRVVCRVSGPDRDANARLIAAAPELFEALRNFTDGRNISYADALAVARAALSKANGEQA